MTHLTVLTTQSGALCLAAGPDPANDYALSALGEPGDIGIVRLHLHLDRPADHDVAGVLVGHGRATPRASQAWAAATAPHGAMTSWIPAVQIGEPPAIADGPSLCRICGCSDDDGCWPPCWWVESDLCSACAADMGVQQRTVMGIDARELVGRDVPGGAS